MILEVVTVLLVRRNLALAAQVGRLLLDAEELELVPCADLFWRTFESFEQQSETRLSFADAAIAHVARERAEGWVITFDEEFEKLGGIRISK